MISPLKTEVKNLAGKILDFGAKDRQGDWKSRVPSDTKEKGRCHECMQQFEHQSKVLDLTLFRESSSEITVHI
jgi:hypothetical protein